MGLATTLNTCAGVPAGAAELRAERVSEAHGVSSSSTTEAFSKLREMPKAFRALIVNPAFFFLNLAGASEGLLLSGFAAFLPKLIENQFSVAASRAALLMGTSMSGLAASAASRLSASEVGSQSRPDDGVVAYPQGALPRCFHYHV